MTPELEAAIRAIAGLRASRGGLAKVKTGEIARAALDAAASVRAEAGTTAGPIPPAGARNAALEEAATVARKYADDQKIVQHKQWTFMYRAAEEIETGIRALKQDATPSSPQPPAPAEGGTDVAEIIQALRERASCPVAGPGAYPYSATDAGFDRQAADALTAQAAEIAALSDSRDHYRHLSARPRAEITRLEAALAAKEAEIETRRDEVQHQDRVIAVWGARIAELEAALRRTTDCLDTFIRESEDPGTEALAAVYCARAALSGKEPQKP